MFGNVDCIRSLRPILAGLPYGVCAWKGRPPSPRGETPRSPVPGSELRGAQLLELPPNLWVSCNYSSVPLLEAVLEAEQMGEFDGEESVQLIVSTDAARLGVDHVEIAQRTVDEAEAEI